MQHLTEYDDHKFINIAKDDLKLPDKKDDKSAKPDKDAFKGLTKWWKAQLGDKVAGVKLSSRLSSTPCVVVTSKYGQSANMERIMRAQVGGWVGGWSQQIRDVGWLGGRVATAA